MTKLADRIHQINPFQAVVLSRLANQYRHEGKNVISMGIGEPDFTAPELVVHELMQAVHEGKSGYSPSMGIHPLRECIAQYYNQEFSTQVEPEQVIITNGGSGALALVSLAYINPGDEILMPDPSYPANKSFITCAGGVPRLIPTTVEQRFQLTAELVQEHWTPQTKGVLLGSPSNPTGTSIPFDELEQIIAVVKQRAGIVIMDEIYLGLYYGDKPKSALFLDPSVIVINSFSKYFHMTGWRLGWIILPPQDVEGVEKLASNFSICAPTLAQHAALACFEDKSMQIYEQRRLLFKQRRDYLIPELESMGITVPVVPDGAFYIYADISQHSDDSYRFAFDLLEKAHVVVVPGLDFGQQMAHQMIRLSYATAMDQLLDAMGRMRRVLCA